MLRFGDPESFGGENGWELLVGGLEHVFFHILGIIIPTDFHSIIFQRGRAQSPTRQVCQHNYGKSLFSMGKSTINGHFQWENHPFSCCDFRHVPRQVAVRTSWRAPMHPSRPWPWSCLGHLPHPKWGEWFVDRVKTWATLMEEYSNFIIWYNTIYIYIWNCIYIYICIDISVSILCTYAHVSRKL